MVDVFDEVEEQLRSERYSTLFKKGWPYAVGLVLVLLIGFGVYWGYTELQANRSAKASETYVAASDALAGGRQAEAEKAFTELSKSGPGTYKALALMQLAGLKLEANSAEAVALFDQAAAAAKEPLVQDAARLKAAYAVFDTASLADVRKRLDPLTEAGRPYAALAREAVAMKQLAAGQINEARTSFSVLSLLTDASEDLRTRAQAAVALIDSGAYKAVPQVVDAAAKLPPAAAAAPVAVGSAAIPPAAAPPASNTTGEAQ